MNYAPLTVKVTLYITECGANIIKINEELQKNNKKLIDSCQKLVYDQLIDLTMPTAFVQKYKKKL